MKFSSERGWGYPLTSAFSPLTAFEWPSHFFLTFELAIASCTPLVPFVPFGPFVAKIPSHFFLLTSHRI